MTRLVTPSTDPPRLAFAVGRSVGNAVVRNRVRRRLRHAAARHGAALEPGCSYLVAAGPAAADATYRELEDTLGEILAVYDRVGR